MAFQRTHIFLEGISLTCTVKPIEVKTESNVEENIGFIVKLESIPEGSPTQLKKKANKNFEFRYERVKNLVGEYHENPPNSVESPRDVSDIGGSDKFNTGNDEVIERSFLSDIATPMRSPNRDANRMLFPSEGKNYAQDIVTMRLVNQKLVNVEVLKDEIIDDTEMLIPAKGSLFNNVDDGNKDNEEDQKSDFNSMAKFRKALNHAIAEKSVPPAIRRLKLIAVILFVILVAMAAVSYFYFANAFDDIEENVHLIVTSNDRVREFMSVMSRVRDLTLLNMGVFTASTYYSEDNLRSDLFNSLTQLEKIQGVLLNSNLGLSGSHERLHSDDIVPIYRKLGSDSLTSQTFNLFGALNEIISRAYKIYNVPLANITRDNSDVFVVEYNLLNDFYTAMRTDVEYYILELIDRVSLRKTAILIILIVSAMIILISLVLFFPLLIGVHKASEEVLSLFLDIPEKTVKNLYTRCENFISTLQLGEDEEIMSEGADEDLEKDDDNEETSLTPETFRRKRKKFKNTGQSRRQVFIRFVLGGLVLAGYFIFNFFIAEDLLSDMSAMIPEINVTSMSAGYSAFVENVERQLILDNTFKILSSEPMSVAVSNIQGIYELDAFLNQVHSSNVGINSVIYNEAFKQIMMFDPCQLSAFLSVVSLAECEAFADGSVYQGMAVSTTRHYDNLRFLLTLYITYSRAKPSDVNTTSPYYVRISNDTVRNQILSIYNLPQATEVGKHQNPFVLNILTFYPRLDQMQSMYIKAAFQYLMDQFQKGLSDDYSEKNTECLAVYIVFNVVVVIIFFVLWQPLIARLNKNVIKENGRSELTEILLLDLENEEDAFDNSIRRCGEDQKRPYLFTKATPREKPWGNLRRNQPSTLFFRFGLLTLNNIPKGWTRRRLFEACCQNKRKFMTLKIKIEQSYRKEGVMRLVRLSYWLIGTGNQGLNVLH